MSKAKAWGDNHRREALRRTYEIAAEVVFEEANEQRAHYLLNATRGWASEERWRDHLARCRIDPARIDREVRRVRALAEGRLVRDTRWRVEGTDAAEEDGCFWDEPTPPPASVRKNRRTVRVTRIRRAAR